MKKIFLIFLPDFLKYTELVKIYEAKFYPESVKTAAFETLERGKRDVEWTNAYVDTIEAWLSESDYNGTTTEPPSDSGSRLEVCFGVLLLLLLSLLCNVF